MHLGLSPEEQSSIKIYDEEASAGRIDQTPAWADDFSSQIFHDLPGDGEVVDVGCGTGRFVQILPDLNIHRYLGIDPSMASIDYCRQTYPEHQFAVGSIQTMGAVYPERFSGFIMTTTLMHIPRRSLQMCLRSLRQSLKVGARGFVSFSIDEHLLVATNSYGMNLTLYTMEEMERQFPLHGLSINYMFSPKGYTALVDVVAV